MRVYRRTKKEAISLREIPLHRSIYTFNQFGSVDDAHIRNDHELTIVNDIVEINFDSHLVLIPLSPPKLYRYSSFNLHSFIREFK